MIIAVFPYLENENSIEITKSVLTELKKLDCTVMLDSECKSKVDFNIDSFGDADEIIKKCDIAIAIGGDGTTLRVAKKAAVHSKEVLGINGGRLGFMSGIEKNELSLLKNLVDKKYTVDERIMLRCDVIDNGKIISTQHCLNDAVVARGDFARLIDVDVSSDNGQLISVRGDGVIISTPTGSTAYSMAAGGPVVSPETNCFVITSICPHSLIDRSIVVPSQKPLYLRAYSDTKNNSTVTADGKMPVIVTSEMSIKISLSEYTAKLIKIKPDNFYEILRKKIIERGA